MTNTRPLPDRLKDYEADRHAEIKAALKEAVQEWMDDKFRQVGKWTVRGITAAALAALTYFILHFGGWPK